MNGLLITDPFRKDTSLQALRGRFSVAARQRGITLERRQSAEFLYAFPGGDFLTPLPESDFVLFWSEDARLAAMLEQAGLRLYNSAYSVALCGDKALTHFALQDFPTPRTVPCPAAFRYDDRPGDDLLRPAEEAIGYPMVIKECFGCQTHFARNRQEMLSILRESAGKPLLFQESIQESAGQSLRLYMVDGACVAAARLVNGADLRAKPCVPTEQETVLARKACEKLGLLFAEVDILQSIRGPLLNGIDPGAPFTETEALTGADIAGDILEAILRKGRGALG